MEYNHLPDCKHPHAPIDVCGCEVKILQVKVDDLTDSVFQYGIDNTKLQIQRDALQAKVEDLPFTVAMYKEITKRHEEIAIEKRDLQAKVEKLTDRIKWLEINWCNPNGEGA